MNQNQNPLPPAPPSMVSQKQSPIPPPPPPPSLPSVAKPVNKPAVIPSAPFSLPTATPPQVQPPQAPQVAPVSDNSESLTYPPKPLNFDEMISEAEKESEALQKQPPVPIPRPAPPIAVPTNPITPPTPSTPLPANLPMATATPPQVLPIEVPLPTPPPSAPQPIMPALSGNNIFGPQPNPANAPLPQNPIQPLTPPTVQQAILSDEEQGEMFGREKLSTLQKVVIIIIATVALGAVVGVGYWLYQQTIDLSAKPPVIVDADADGLTDAREQELGTNPQKADTDEDGYQDFEEI